MLFRSWNFEYDLRNNLFTLHKLDQLLLQVINYEGLSSVCKSCTINITLRLQRGSFSIRHTQKACNIFKRSDFAEISNILYSVFLYSMHIETKSWMECQRRCRKHQSHLVCVRDRQRLSHLLRPWSRRESFSHLLFRASLMYVGFIISNVSKLSCLKYNCFDSFYD